jgi:O-antigen/teichoic acid export membrane protein
VSLVLFSGYLLAGGQGLDLRTVLLVLVTAQFATLLVQVALDPQFLRLFRVAAAPFEWRAVSAGLVLIPAALFYQALSFFDRLSLSSFVSYETSGHYSLAAQGIAIAYAVLGGTIITLFYPRLVRSSEHGPTLETTRLLRFAFGSGAVACVAGVAAIFLLSPLIKVVFGDRYAESVWMLQAMCLVPLCMFVLSGLSHVAYLFDALRLSAIAYAIGCFECMALYYEMVPRFGVAGAVSATYISLTTIALLHLGIVLRRSTLVRQGDPVR